MTYPFQTGSPSSDPVPSEINRKESNAMIYGPADVARLIGGGRLVTVYVLMLECDYEPSYLRGVYSSLEAARKAAEIVATDTGMDKVAIYPVKLDALPLDIMAYFKAVDPVTP